MTKLELYNKLKKLLNNYIVNNTKVTTYVDNVIKLVKQYLKEKNND